MTPETPTWRRAACFLFHWWRHYDKVNFSYAEQGDGTFISTFFCRKCKLYREVRS